MSIEWGYILLWTIAFPIGCLLFYMACRLVFMAYFRSLDDYVNTKEKDSAKRRPQKETPR